MNDVTVTLSPRRAGLRAGADQTLDVLVRIQAGPAKHVRPRLPLPVEALGTGRPVEAPPLLRGYLRCGAKLLGPPAWDPDFGTADLPVMMRLADLPARYRRHFLGG